MLHTFYQGSNVSLGGFSLAGSWCIEGEVTLPIRSPLFDGHAAVVRLEISNDNGICVKLYLESKLQLPCFGVDLRYSLSLLIVPNQSYICHLNKCQLFIVFCSHA